MGRADSLVYRVAGQRALGNDRFCFVPVGHGLLVLIPAAELRSALLGCLDEVEESRETGMSIDVARFVLRMRSVEHDTREVAALLSVAPVWVRSRWMAACPAEVVEALNGLELCWLVLAYYCLLAQLGVAAVVPAFSVLSPVAVYRFWSDRIQALSTSGSTVSPGYDELRGFLEALPVDRLDAWDASEWDTDDLRMAAARCRPDVCCSWTLVVKNYIERDAN